VAEDHSSKPNSPYSSSKAGVRPLAALGFYHRTYGIPVMVTAVVRNN